MSKTTRKGNYNPAIVKKVLAAIRAKPISVPSDEKGYFMWLKRDSK